MASNASELFYEMLSCIDGYYTRDVSDPTSPCRRPTMEAKPGCTFQLNCTRHNVVDFRKIDWRWAIANTLHFFANTEDARCLSKYNRHAERFCSGGRWVGAYGAIAMPQISVAVHLLKQHRQTRRAVVTMGNCMKQDINQPACWSMLHFMVSRHGLNTMVYQRSLHLVNVMPYDVVLLTNIHEFVAEAIGVPAASLVWTVGSLHMDNYTAEQNDVPRTRSIMVPFKLLNSPHDCMDMLENPDESTLGSILRMESCVC